MSEIDNVEKINSAFNLGRVERVLEGQKLYLEIGKVTKIVGFLIEGYLPGALLGSLCEVYHSLSKEPVPCEVVGFRDRRALLLPFRDHRGVGLGSRIILRNSIATVGCGAALLGRVINALGEPIDGKGPLEDLVDFPLYRSVANPMSREPIREPIDIGVRAINAFATMGTGQRMSIMAGSGVGKSVLMSMVAKNSKADINVIAMVGERGREVREFIENDLGEEGLKKSVIVVATGDESPLLRMRAAFVATAVAESYCDSGSDVLLIMDSVTRFAMAQREIGLTVGEPPTTKGYPPSVFGLLPRLLERAGSFEKKGSITGLYTVLVEGDDMDDPIGDQVRSIVDGHIVLDRRLAEQGHFPAIDVLASTSRVQRFVVDERKISLSRELRSLMSAYQKSEDLFQIGAYKRGNDAHLDRAVDLKGKIDDFLRQSEGEPTNLEIGFDEIETILASSEGRL